MKLCSSSDVVASTKDSFHTMEEVEVAKGIVVTEVVEVEVAKVTKVGAVVRFTGVTEVEVANGIVVTEL